MFEFNRSIIIERCMIKQVSNHFRQTRKLSCSLVIHGYELGAVSNKKWHFINLCNFRVNEMREVRWKVLRESQRGNTNLFKLYVYTDSVAGFYLLVSHLGYILYSVLLEVLVHERRCFG